MTKKFNGEIITQNIKFQANIKVTVLLALSAIPLVFVPLGGEFDHFYLPKVAAMFTLIVAFLIVLLLNIKKIDKFIKRDCINLHLLIYLFFLVISVFNAENTSYAVYGTPGRYEGIITIILYMTLFLIARACPELKEKNYIFVLITALIVSIYGISQYLGFDPFPRDVLRIDWGARSFSTMGNPNFLGSYLVLLLPISIYLFIINNRKIGFLSYIILFYCLLTTSTRGAWLGAIASIICFTLLHLIYFKFKRDEFTRYIILFLISVTIVLVFNYQTDGALLNRFFTISKDAKEFLFGGDKSDFTGAHRGFIWKHVIELIKNRPLTGYGLENLGETFVKYYSEDMIEFWGEVRNPDKAHNEFLHIAVTSGIPSLATYILFVGLIIKKGLLHIKNNRMFLLLISSIFGYLFAGFFNISVVSVAYVYWIFLGLISSNHYNDFNSYSKRVSS